MNTDTTPDNIGLILAIASILTVLATWVKMYWNNKSSNKKIKLLEAQLRSSIPSSSSTPFDFITQEYLDRRFKSTKPPIIDENTIPELRVAKRIAIDKYRIRDNKDKPWYKSCESRKKWREDSHVDKKEWQNSICLELSISLERLGISVFSGIIDCSIFLALAADQVLEDWLICEAWIESYRDKNRNLRDKNKNIHFHRRHAEWLAI